MRPSNFSATSHGGATAVNHRNPSNFRSFRPPYPNQRPNFPANFRRFKPPDPHPNHSPPANFIVELHHRPNTTTALSGSARKAFTEGLIAQCEHSPDNYVTLPYGPIAGMLFFTQWNFARETVVGFWKSRLSGNHEFTPHLIANIIVPSDVVELNDRLKPLFEAKLKGLINGEVVNKWENKVEGLVREIGAVVATMKKPLPMKAFHELIEKKKGLVKEKELIEKRLDEFKAGIGCILSHVKGKGKGKSKGVVEHDDDDDDDDECGKVPIFRFNDGFTWSRIFHLMMRECRRLDDGLPIYGFRQEILQCISSQQIMVLIGETGSGKSTQLLQFLGDSGLVTDGSVVCTQPRKIAAISLAQRVQEESYGCYEDNAISCNSSYSSAHQFTSKLIYTTDHGLLQNCMNDRYLHGVSCIIVDEAHERSLNTDLLLALLKNLLPPRPDLRLIIMSATADAKQLSDYFFGCGMFTVVGRQFPVDVKYVPCSSEGTSQSVMLSAADVAPYVSDVVRLVTEVHRTEQEGTILAFLTSPLEVEWACERFLAPNAEPLPLHGKLSSEEQSRVFQDYSGKRKVIFATNVAETSLTIPGVKYVIDSGMAKENKFEPGSGMNVLKVCRISKSSANQRAGRAGRTEPGHCYRLYSQDDFQLLPAQQEPEIRRVHLGVAVLKIIALGIKNIKEFDFVDAPSPEAIDMAIRNLIQLGAVTLKDGDIELTDDGRYLVKLGIEPRLGKLILGCVNEQLKREGLVLAALMANSSSIFCRVGNPVDKLKSDRLKVPFCHRDGDLFTLLSVYKAWEDVPREKKNRWCWENSINAKSMRRCHDTVLELENCLKSELRIIVPSYWFWKPDAATQHNRNLKKAILASLAENVAMYSGCDKLGYKVALTGQYVRLHPGCSLRMFNHKPSWVVFGEILSASDQYLVCVTSFDQEFLSTLSPPPLFDASEMESQKLQVTTLSGFGKTLLKKLCGKFNSGLLSLVSRIRKICGDERINIEVDVENNEIRLFSSPHDTEKILNHVGNALDLEKRMLQSECMEMCLYHGCPGLPPPVALFGSGAEIKHLEIDKRCLTVDVFCLNVSAIDDKELIFFIGNYAPGICAVHKFTVHRKVAEEREKWGSITFLTPDAAKRAAELNGIEFNGSVLEINLSGTTFGVDRVFSFPAVKARLFWPRRFSKGYGILKCEVQDVGLMIEHFSNLQIGERYVRCEAGCKSMDSIVIYGIDKQASEPEILYALRSATDRKILDFFLVRGDAVDNNNPPCHAYEEALFREISVFMPKGSPHINHCRVQVFPPGPKDTFMKALITFDGRLHLEAAKALEQIEGTVLPGLQSWQKIQCQHLFHTSVSCSSIIYSVIRRELHSLIARYQRQRGVECTFSNANGTYRVKISATATKIVAELRRPLEDLMKGRTIIHASLTPAVLQLLFSKDGITLMKSLEREMGIFLLFDRQSLNVRIFGPSDKVVVAEKRFIQCLLNLHENKKLVVHLRGGALPYDLMKEVVKTFGPNLDGLKEKVPEAELTLDTRHHIIFVSGKKEARQKVEEIVSEIALTSGHLSKASDCEKACPICLCEVEDEYQLESCMHVFCRSCLVEQCECAIKNYDSFPIRCAHEGCGQPFWLVDLKDLMFGNKMEELFMASLGAFVASSGGTYRFCPSPDCRSVYLVAGPYESGEPFVCGACYAETCTKCHLEYHPFLSCEKYKEYKEDPDSSLKEWCRGKEEDVKRCPICGYTIEKAEGCNHVECKCGRHLCWVCLEPFCKSDDCYNHLRTIHQGIT